ncbi:hypothetical protein ACOMHN_002325 [Nucella lapillus]
MAFTLLLSFLLALTSFTAVIEAFGGLGRFGPQSLAFGNQFAGGGFAGGFPGRGSFPGPLGRQDHDSRRSKPRMLTARLIGPDGDFIALNFYESQSQRQSPLGGSPFGMFGALGVRGGLGVPGGPGSRGKSVTSFTGVYHSSRSSGALKQNALRGTYDMVVMEYGNIADGCVGVGSPYVSMQERQKQHSLSSPFGGLQSPFHSPFQSGFQSPFGRNRYGQGQQQGMSSKLSARINANFASSELNGEVNLSMDEMAGRSIALCPESRGQVLCQVTTNICGTIVHDIMSVSDFEVFKNQQRALSLAQQGSSGLQPGFNGLIAVNTDSKDSFDNDITDTFAF